MHRMYQSRSLWKETRSGRHAGSSSICNKKGLSAVTTQLRAEGVEISTDINHLITLNLFVTITNANFDKDAIVSRIHTSLEVKKETLSNSSPHLLLFHPQPSGMALKTVLKKKLQK